MKFLITGGGGFIGSFLVIDLLKKGNKVTVFDNISNSSKEKILSLTKKGAIFVQGDIIDYNSIRNALIDIDFVIHLAAKVNVSESVLNPEQTFHTNVDGTVNVLKACVENQIKNIIVASSAAVYGDSEILPLSENSLTHPISPYGESKLRMEDKIKQFSIKYNLNSIILRFFNIYGKGQTTSYAGVIIKFLENIFKNNSLTIFGDGSNSRDFISLDDIINSINLSIRHIDGKRGNVYNIGTGNFVSITGLAQLMLKVSKKELPIEFKTAKKSDIHHSQTVIDLAKADLGFSPKITLEEGLKKLFNLK